MLLPLPLLISASRAVDSFKIQSFKNGSSKVGDSKYKSIYRQASIQAYIHTGIQADIQAYRQTYRRKDRQNVNTQFTHAFNCPIPFWLAFQHCLIAAFALA